VRAGTGRRQSLPAGPTWLDLKRRTEEHPHAFFSAENEISHRAARRPRGDLPRTQNPNGVGIIFRQFVDFVWLLLKWTAGLAVCAGVALGFYFYHRFDDEVRRTVEAKLGEKYPHLRVTVREAQLVRGEGLRIRGLSIIEPNRAGPQEELLFVDDLFLHCSTDPRDLIHGKLNVTKLHLQKPVLRARRNVDGTWSSAKLLPLPKFGDGMPTGVIEGGVLEITDARGDAFGKLALRNAELQWSVPEGEYAPGTRKPLNFRGTLAADHVRNIKLDAVLDPIAGGAWTATGEVDTIELGAELRKSLPAALAEPLAKFDMLQAKISAKFRAGFQPPPPATAEQPEPPTSGTFDFALDGKVAEGRIVDARLPHPISDLSCNFHVDRGGLAVTDLAARHGTATLGGRLAKTGLSLEGPLELNVSARRLTLDTRMLDLLPASWQTQWNNFLPAGEIDVDAAMTYDGQTWRPQVSVNCLNGAFTYHKFPYRLERGRGRLELRDKQLTFDLTALANSEEVRIMGDLALAGPHTSGWTDIRGAGLLIDERLIRAMPDNVRPTFMSLNPQGRFNLSLRVERPAPGTDIWHKHSIVHLQDCSLRFEKFPYPLSGVFGTVETRDDLWTFHDDLQGVNDTGRILCRGGIAPGPEGAILTLGFHGDNVPIDEELRTALSPGAQRLWNDMKPRGLANFDAEVRFHLQQKTLSLAIRAEPVGDTVGIEPSYFPYRLDKVRGLFTFADGRVQMENVRAEHGETQISSVGECLIDPNGGWRLDLQRLFVDRLVVDRDLLNALPEALKKSTTALEPTGHFNVRGNIAFAGSGEPGRPLAADWNLSIDCHNNSLQCGVPLHGIHGSLSLVGSSNAGRFESSGELQLDSVFYGDYQMTEVLGPLWIDNEQVLLGFWADRRRGHAPERRLTGKLYGGTTVSDGWIVLGDEPEYALLATLTKGDLARFAQERIPGNGRLSGEIFATVDLRGKGRTRNNVQGRGSVQLRNADIYQLPAMVSFLKVLSLRTPDTTAFTQSDIQFSLQGEHLYLERIDFDGDAVSLQGRGELNLVNDQINLVFRTVVGSDSAKLPAVKQILGGASQQILLMHVDGTVKNPQVRREAFPGVNQVLEQLQAELQRPVQPNLQNGATRITPQPNFPLDRN
jgi:hypothetical protein